MVAMLTLTGCGGHKSDPAAKAECVQRAVTRAIDAAVVRAYGADELGSPAQVRADLKALGPQPGYTVTSFLTGTGALVAPMKMSAAQHQTFTAWWRGTKRVASVLGDAPDQAGARAADDAKSSCANA